MKIWRLTRPRNSGFAAAGARGAWKPGELCPECTRSTEERTPPLQLVWEPGSDQIGDFVWAGPAVAARREVVDVLRKPFTGVEPGPVGMVDEPPPTAAQRRQPRVQLPYQGPELQELWVTASVPVDRARSSIELERRCTTCGTEYWEVYGVERWAFNVDPDTCDLAYELIPRTPKGGLFVRPEDLPGADIFWVQEAPAWILCTDEVRDWAVSEGCTNVAFLEVGEIS